MQLELAERLGEAGQEFRDWTVSGLRAYAKYGYDPAGHSFRPMWADGTDLTGYVFSRTGYYGRQGRTLRPVAATAPYLFSYARAYRVSQDEEIWNTLRSIMQGLKLGDPGTPTGTERSLNLKTTNSDTAALFAILELHRATRQPEYLQLAEVIGDNILKRSFHKGFFLSSDRSNLARFDALEPLALLRLEATLQGKVELVPAYSGGANRLDLKTE
jgi:pectate lyase